MLIQIKKRQQPSAGDEGCRRKKRKEDADNEENAHNTADTDELV